MFASVVAAVRSGGKSEALMLLTWETGDFDLVK